MPLYRLNHALIRVSGPDRVGFLHDLMTQSLEGLDRVRYGALLSPQGKVIADMLLWPRDDSIVLETAPAHAADLLRRLSLYKLRAEVSIEEEPGLAVAFSEATFDGAEVDPRLPALGWRKLVAASEATALADGDNAYTRMRLLEGVPDLAADVAPDEVFAGEALLDELNGVDFHKGCFIGQENTSRMKRRATTRRKLCRVAFDGEAFARQTAVRAGAAEIGLIRASTSGCALALLRLDRALAARQSGEKLLAGEREIRLDPPAWLILPQGSEGEGEAATAKD